MKNIIALTISLLAFGMLKMNAQDDDKSFRLNEALVPDTSIFEVIVHADKFGSKEICTVGVLNLGSRQRLSMLYSSMESAKARIGVNAIALSLPDEIDAKSRLFDGSYVVVSGHLETDTNKIRELLGPVAASLVNERLLIVEKIQTHE